MKIANEKNHSCSCTDEYSLLKKVIVSSPEHMRITEIINETQKHYAEDNIDIEKAIQQHENFVKVLQEQGIEVKYTESSPPLNEQVFTRDIGFCIEEQMYISSLASDIRQGEVKPLIQLMTQMDLPFTRLFAPSIEGGDVMLDHSTIWLGISGRTDARAASYLEKVLPDHEIIPLPLREDILHLDCAFNILSENEAVIYPDAFSQADLERLERRFSLIRVNDQEQFEMGTNVLSIGNRKVLSLPQNKRLNAVLSEWGFHVIEVDLSEIIKSGGSFRCCTLPIKREDQPAPLS